MSNIGNGVLGIAQGQASAKGKAGHAKAGDMSAKGDFAKTIASLHARDDDGSRKGGRVSISGNGRSEIQAEQAGSTQAKAMRRDVPALAEALSEAGAENAREVRSAFEDVATRPSETGVEKPVALTETAIQPPRKDHGEARDSKATLPNPDKQTARTANDKAIELNAEKRAARDANDGATPSSDEAPVGNGGTDVGNLLDLLAAPAADAASGADEAVAEASTTARPIESAGAAGAAAMLLAVGADRLSATGMPQDALVQADGTMPAKGDLPADKANAKAVDAAGLPDTDDAGDMPVSDTDQLFRLVRADGKGRDVDMTLSGAGDRAAFRDASATGPKGETVTVVDARRYIGLAQTGNAAVVTTAITQDPQWAASLSATGGLTHAEAAATGKVVNTLKIQMNPIELGLVTATLRLHGDELVVSLQVETGEAYRQLTDDQDAIVRALRGQGFAVDQVSVQLTPVDRSTGSQPEGQAQQQQFSSQPQAREGGSGREQRGDGSGSFAREGRSHEGNTSETASGLAGSQSVRSGGVYL